MLLYLLRNIKLFALALTRPKIDPLGTASLKLRVRLTDLDYNLHMNNSRYLESMEMGRLDMMTRVGLIQAAAKNRLAPVIGALQIVYRHQLKPFQAYTVTTKVLGWDEKWIYVEQDMISPGRIHATAVIKAAFLDKGKTMLPRDVMALVGLQDLSPPVPPQYIKLMNEGQTLKYEALKERHKERLAAGHRH